MMMMMMSGPSPVLRVGYKTMRKTALILELLMRSCLCGAIWMHFVPGT